MCVLHQAIVTGSRWGREAASPTASPLGFGEQWPWASFWAETKMQVAFVRDCVVYDIKDRSGPLDCIEIFTTMIMANKRSVASIRSIAVL